MRDEMARCFNRRFQQEEPKSAPVEHRSAGTNGPRQGLLHSPPTRFVQRKPHGRWGFSRAGRKNQLAEVFFRERAVARSASTKRIDEAQCFVELGIFLGGFRNGTVERLERFASHGAVGLWADRGWLGSQVYVLVEGRRSLCCGHTSRKRTALGNERTLEALNEEIEKSGAIGPSVDIDEARQGGAFHGTVDLGQAHLERSSQFRIGRSSLRRGQRELHGDDDVLWPYRHVVIIVSRFAKCKTMSLPGESCGRSCEAAPSALEDGPDLRCHRAVGQGATQETSGWPGVVRSPSQGIPGSQASPTRSPSLWWGDHR